MNPDKHWIFFALPGMWRLGDSCDVGSTVGRASVPSASRTPAGPHKGPWTVFVPSKRSRDSGVWLVQEGMRAESDPLPPPPPAAWHKCIHQVALNANTSVCAEYRCLDAQGHGGVVELSVYTSLWSASSGGAGGVGACDLDARCN